MKAALALAAGLTIATGASPALAWWQYAEWGLSASQIMTASGGRAVPCRADVPGCTAPPGGLQPTYAVESLTMVGMPGSASFAFDAGDRLVQTVVLFPESDVALLSGLLQGIHGAAGDSTAMAGFWRDERRGTVITALP